jgi:PAS domain S-box-containing protein
MRPGEQAAAGCRARELPTPPHDRHYYSPTASPDGPRTNMSQTDDLLTGRHGEASYRALVENANSIILRWSVDGRIALLNECGQRFFGYAADEIVGRHVVGTIVPATDSGGRDLHSYIAEICASPEAFGHSINENMRRNGERAWVSWTNRVVRDQAGRVVEFVSIGVDVTESRLAAEELKKSEARYRALFERVPVGIVYADAGSHFLDANDSICHMLGYSREELIRLQPADIVMPVEAPQIPSALDEIRLRGEHHREWQLRRKDGTLLFAEVTATTMPDGTLLGMIRDTTALHEREREVAARDEARRRAEATLHSEQQFSHSMIESMPGVVYLYDMAGRFLRWNQDFEKVTGYSAGEIAGMHPLDFFSDEDKPRIEARIAEVFATGESAIEASFVSRDGRSWPYYFTGRRVVFRDLTCLVGVGIDISERKQAEAERDRRHRAEAADRIKSAFLASMSHELRTPLNSIVGFTGILLQGLAGPLNAEQGKQLDMVRTSARHLLAVVNDVLDISKIEAGQLEVRRARFDISRSIGKVAGIVRPQVEAKGLELRVELPPELASAVSDERRFEQILLNLLSNAVKFTERGQVTLAAQLIDWTGPAGAGPAQPAIRLSVTDTGIGIDAEELPQLFQPFRQVDSGLARRHEGTGLGLAICRRLAVLMGGEIDAESELGKGSRFVVTLPLERPVSS